MNWDDIEKHCGKHPNGTITESALWASDVQNYLLMQKINKYRETTMLIPVAKRVLIQPIHDDKNGVIIITNKKPIQYNVIAIGDEVTKVRPGNVIYLEKHYGIEIDYENEKFLVIDEASILAKIG